MIKLMLAAGVLAVGAVFLMITTTRGSAEYYETIPELHSHPADNVRVAGVVASPVDQQGDRTTFWETSGKDRLRVTYQGALPQIFKPGIQVVAQGSLGSDGVFHAQSLQTKCPSHFSTATP